MVFDGRHSDTVSPGDTRVAFALGGRPARYIRITALRLWERSADFVFALGELEAFEGGANVARHAVVTASDSTRTGAWDPRFLVDGEGGSGTLQPEESWLAGLARRRVLSLRRGELLRQKDEAAALVRERLLTLSGGLALLALASVGLVIRRSHAARARELEVLRQQISRDLHDEIGSSLCSIRLMAELSGATGQGRPPAEALSEISQLAQSGTEALRDLVWLLKEGSRPKVGVLLEKMRAVAGALLVNVRWSFDAVEVPLEAVAPLSFHRDVLFIFREALHNVVKHAGAPSVEIHFGWSPGTASLSITDSGCGFDASGGAPGDGIENMRHRARQLQGTLILGSRPGGGTRLELKIPTP
jgi:signal transduction histidine kinase